MATTAGPVIGISPCSRLDDYVAAITEAGACARVLEIAESPRRIAGDVHGLLLTGGGDVDPAFYGEARHPATVDAEPGRDEFELDLARRALDDDIPLLAVCRGTQVLNVAAGGTLIQDIPSAVPDALPHAVNEPKDRLCHTISVLHGSRLSAVLGGLLDDGTCHVNSRHHQSIGRPGAGLAVSAAAPDGIIEAVEKPDARFCIGVQWHPENLRTNGRFNTLFEALVAAARERQLRERR